MTTCPMCGRPTAVRQPTSAIHRLISIQGVRDPNRLRDTWREFVVPLLKDGLNTVRPDSPIDVRDSQVTTYLTNRTA